MTCSHLRTPLILLPVFLLPAAVRAPAPPTAGETHTIEIRSDGYHPAALAVRHGDVVRFVQMDGPAHNIEFQGMPTGARFAPEYVGAVNDLEVIRPSNTTARTGPFLIGVGRTYEIRIGEEMPEGAYVFGCSRHTGWWGSMVVTDEELGPIR